MRDALEAAIDEDPDDPRNYLVLADWLQEQGEWLGELIARQVAIETGRFEPPPWIAAYPTELTQALAVLAVVDPDAEQTAQQVLTKEVPTPAQIQTQLDAMRALPENPSRQRYIERLEALLETPHVRPAGHLQKTAAGIVRRAKAIALERLAPAPWAPPIIDALEWRHGFIRRADLKFDNSQYGETLRAFLAHPAARFLAALSIRGDNSLHPAIETITAQPRPSLRELHFGRDTYTPARVGRVGDASGLWLSLPRLEQLHVSGGEVRLGDFAPPRLRTLDFFVVWWSPDTVTDLADAKLPSLERLRLRGGTLEQKQLRKILANVEVPALRMLALRDVACIDAFVEDLAELPILRDLRVLDLSASGLTDAGGRAIINRAHAFRHLERLDLSQNRLRTTASELTALGFYAPLL